MAGSAATDGGSRWPRFHGRINNSADAFFYRLGYWVSKHAKLTLAISVVSIIGCCFGFANFEVVTSGEYGRKLNRLRLQNEHLRWYQYLLVIGASSFAPMAEDAWSNRFVQYTGVGVELGDRSSCIGLRNPGRKNWKLCKDAAVCQ